MLRNVGTILPAYTIYEDGTQCSETSAQFLLLTPPMKMEPTVFRNVGPIPVYTTYEDGNDSVPKRRANYFCLTTYEDGTDSVPKRRPNYSCLHHL